MSRLAIPLGAKDHVIGPDEAPITLVEYGDYQCPHCAAAQPVIGDVLDVLGERVRFAYRHFPLANVHPYAEEAAEAAEAADECGRFWDMHSMLFERQQELDPRGLLALAEALNLDQRMFVDALERHEHRAKVKNDFRGGVRSGVNGTPTFFINGVRYDGPIDAGALLAAIEPITARFG